MTALRYGLVVALVLAEQGCTTGAVWDRRHTLAPPAMETRAGAPERSTGPDSRSAQATSNANATASAPSPLPSPLAGGKPPFPPAGERGVSSTATPTPTATSTSADVTAALTAVSSLVGRRSVVLDGVDYGSGCAAVVRAAFARVGRALPAEARDAAAIYALARVRGALTTSRTPVPGDLVFLADRPGGPAAHVGLVTRSQPDGTAVVLHRTRFGVLRLRLNLAYPSRSTDPATGKQINDALLVGGRSEPAGKLVVGVADLLRREAGPRPTTAGALRPTKG